MLVGRWLSICDALEPDSTTRFAWDTDQDKFWKFISANTSGMRMKDLSDLVHVYGFAVNDVKALNQPRGQALVDKCSKKRRAEEPPATQPPPAQMPRAAEVPQVIARTRCARLNDLHVTMSWTCHSLSRRPVSTSSRACITLSCVTI